MEQVNAILEDEWQVSVDDIADWHYAVAYENGETPRGAARKAFRAAVTG